MATPRHRLIDWFGARRATDVILILAALVSAVALLWQAVQPGPCEPVRIEGPRR